MNTSRHRFVWLKVSEALPLAVLPVGELMNSRGNVQLTWHSIEGWREGPHDDLELAVARGNKMSIDDGRPSILDLSSGDGVLV
jgi:hypothetical protein